MTPTEKDLERLVDLLPDRFDVVPDGFWDREVELYLFLNVSSLVDRLNANHFDSIIRELLSPWTPVPCGDEFALIRTDKTIPTLGRPFHLPCWYSEDEGTVMDFAHATHFDSPLDAAEALHNE